MRVVNIIHGSVKLNHQVVKEWNERCTRYPNQPHTYFDIFMKYNYMDISILVCRFFHISFSRDETTSMINCSAMKFDILTKSLSSRIDILSLFPKHLTLCCVQFKRLQETSLKMLQENASALSDELESSCLSSHHITAANLMQLSDTQIIIGHHVELIASLVSTPEPASENILLQIIDHANNSQLRFVWKY